MSDAAQGGNHKHTILVVDDDPDIRELLSLLLAQEGYAVLSAKDGQDALHQLRAAARRPELIFLDLRMPIMNGWQFLEEQRRDPSSADIPIVVITADRSAAAASAVQMAADVLFKPFDYEDVVTIAARLMKAAR